MQPANPGLILPFYTSSEATLHTVHDGYGILVSDRNIIPWSLTMPVATGGIPTPIGVGDVTWTLRPLNGDPDIAMPDGLISFASDGVTDWAYYDGTAILGTIPCGDYEIVVEWLRDTFYSDAVTVASLSNVLEKTRSVYKLTSSSSQSHNNILYGVGYQQVFYFQGKFDAVFDDEPEVLENGDGVQFIAHAQVRDSLAFLATNVPDSALSGLHEAKYHNVKIERIAGGSPVSSNKYDLAVSPIGDRNNVTITVERAVYITRACEPEIVLI